MENLDLDCAGVASIQESTEHREYVCPYSGEFIDEGELCLVLKECEETDEGVWFLLEHVRQFLQEVRSDFDKGIEMKKYHGGYELYKLTEGVRFGTWEPEQDCLLCGEVVEEDDLSIYFLGLQREGYEFIHCTEECIYGFCDLIESGLDSPEVFSRII